MHADDKVHCPSTNQPTTQLQQMPIELRHKKTNQVQAMGILGNSMRCGHCDNEINGTWVALDDPYYCLIHEQCISLFDFNRKARTQDGEGRKEISQHFDWMLKTLHDLSQKRWFQEDKRMTEERKLAFQELLKTHQALRNARVIVDQPPPPEYAAEYEKAIAAEKAERDERVAKMKARAELKKKFGTADDKKEDEAADKDKEVVVETLPEARPKPKAFIYRGGQKMEAPAGLLPPSSSSSK